MANNSITVRMYNQNNLGDCFLLKIQEKDYLKYILIDFGSYESGNEKRENEIAKDIHNTIGNEPLTIVLTHQHKDHLSGFISSKTIFDKINVDEVWLSFLDDPIDKDAEAMKSVTEKFWKVNKDNKAKLKEKFPNQEGHEVINAMLEAKEGIDQFYAEMQVGGSAISNLREWSKDNVKFLSPGEIVNLNETKVYVLGPPKKFEFLKKLNPDKSEAVHSMNTMLELNGLEISANLLNDALYSKRNNFPFSEQYSTKKSDILASETPAYKQINKYDSIDDAWRKIDFDWLNDVGRMSLHMDNLTNNSSLVLAFELPISKKVLLFVGDAQIGNWKSWFEIEFENSKVKAKELLTRTVLYKAGHHSSHNATLLEALNLMNEKELVIMIPVNETVSTNRHFSMLKPGMLEGYNRKSKGRVLRSDIVFQPSIDANNDITHSEFSKKITIINDATGENHLYLEYTVS